MFKGKRGAQLAKDIAKRTRTFTPGAAVQTEKKTGPSQADVEAIKNAIANASSLAEVERLKGMLQAGQIPGRDLRQGPEEVVEEEEEEEEQEEESDVVQTTAEQPMDDGGEENMDGEAEEEEEEEEEEAEAKGEEEDDGMDEDPPVNGS